MKILFTKKSTFGAKVSMWVIGTASLVFIACFSLALIYNSNRILEEGHHKAELEVDKAVDYVTEKIGDIKEGSRNYAFYYAIKTSKPSPEQVYESLEEYLQCNQNTNGAAIGFKKNEYPEFKNGFAPYVFRKGNQLVRMNIADHRDYFKDEWYKKTLEKNEKRWNVPDIGVIDNYICSYCVPLKNKQGRITGVLASDISLHELSKYVGKIHPYPSSQVFILDARQRFMVHADKNLLKKNLLDTFKEADKKAKVSVFSEKMKRGERGMESFQADDMGEIFEYYAPVSNTGWTIVLECHANEIKKGMRSIRWMMIGISIIGLLVLFVVILLVVKRLTRPLEQFFEEKGKIESELNIASKIQLAILPKNYPPFPDRKDIDIASILYPAKQVGGDFYYYFLYHDQVYFCIGDVSGKGVPASLFMAFACSLFRLTAHQEDNPSIIMQSMNNALNKSNDAGMFITFFVGILNLVDGKLTYCNAGHDAPILIDEKGKVEKIEVEPNLPIAIMPDFEYKNQETTLASGSMLLLYTDGITEAMNKDKKLYGEKRMIEFLKNHQFENAQSVVEGIHGDVKNYVNGYTQSDDITMVALKYTQDRTSTKKRQQIILVNKVGEVKKLGPFMDTLTENAQLEESLVKKIRVALEEAVVNVISYAYPKGTEGTITVDASSDGKKITLTIADMGEPFDPTHVGEVDLEHKGEELPIGGLGIHMIRNIVDEMTYERVPGKNLLKLTKYINKNK